MNAIKRILIFGFLFSSAAVYAQVVSSVTGQETRLWAGGFYSYYNPDYGGRNLSGIGAMFDFNVRPKVGIIGEARWLHWGNTTETQSDYLAGVKYRIWRYKQFDFDAKGVLGGVWITFPQDIGSGSYFAFAPGANADYRLSKRFLIRGAYEWQFLPSAPNIPGQPNHGLTPHGFDIGLEYRVFSTR